MNKAKFLVVALFFLTGFNDLSATHLMGGEITWTCDTGGRYVFQMKLYRDCNGSIEGPTETMNTNAPGFAAGILMNRVSQTDNSPNCNTAGPSITCAGATGTTAGAVEEYIYRSNAIVLSGVPPVSGWVFWFSDCCRNNAISNLGISRASFTLRAKMFSYNGANANPCFDNSPQFYEIPRTVICAGYPFVFNHNAVDKELDSLVYAWDHPLNDNTSNTAFIAPQIPFATDYAYNNPLPDASFDPRNMAAVLNSLSGEVSYTSYTTGTFVLVIKVTAYKCQVKVAEIYREIQVVLNVCPDIIPGYPNTPPILAAPFPDASGTYNLYTDTVYAGENVHFVFSGQDPDLDASFNFQNLSLTASGLEFDPTYSNPNGACFKQPCATLSPSPIGYSTQLVYNTTFDWNTSCDQLGFNQNCRTFSNTYTFVFKFTDDFCPVPGISTATVTIVLLPPPLVAAPELKCASVNLNGDVTISWEPPVDTGGTFMSYEVYYSSSPTGQFALIDSVTNFAQTSYTHVGAGADNSPSYYYLVIKSGCNNYIAPDNYTDTIQAMKLTALNTGNGYARLTWNSTANPLIESNRRQFFIYREYPEGNWALLDIVDAVPGMNMYDDPITACNDTVKYRIEVQDTSGAGCTSVSSIAGDVFQDLIPPTISQIDSVSVNASGLATVAWIQNPANDTYAYVIFGTQGSGWIPLDTVYGISNVFYPTVLDAGISIRMFRILAIDSCRNPSALGSIHNSIYLNADLDVCNGSISLSWNPYINWPAEVEYEIMVSENGQQPVSIGTTNGTSFVHSQLTQNSNYCYFIHGVDETLLSRTSTSNQVCVTARILIKPNFTYIHAATVAGDNQVEIKTRVDNNAEVVRYHILRADATSGNFSVIAAVPADPAVPNFSYTDYTAETGLKSYQYKVVAIDSCGQDAFVSDTARTIFLNATPNDDLTNTIQWNDYEFWLGGVDHYLLYRSVDGVSDGIINTVALGSGLVIDDVNDEFKSEGLFCYYVEAKEGNGNAFGYRETSRSNEMCIAQKPIVFVPNAFHPGSGTLNDEFNPFKAFINGESFLIDIYNRWGENVFHNTNPLIGWDGTFKGQAAPDGVYVYYLKVSGSDQTAVERKGTITLIR